MPAPLILIPPSEAKREGGRRRAPVGAFNDDLADARAYVLDHLRELVEGASTAELSSVLGVRGPLLERAREATVALVEGRARVMPAWQRYSGVVWSHLEPETLSASARRRLIVPSGLYGLNAGDDPIADFRLKMSARLGEGSLAAWWRPVLGASLARYARGRVVYDLLPLEHRAALSSMAPGVHLVSVTFRHGGNGRLAGHDAKAAKGAFARHLALNEPPASFTWGRWSAYERGGSLEVLYEA